MYRHVAGRPTNAELVDREEMFRKGFLGYHVDPANSRLIMNVDPAILNVAAFRHRLDAIAVTANRTARVKGSPLTVTVRRNCFSADQTLAAFARPAEGRAELRLQWWAGWPEPDGRIYAGFADAASAAEAQRRLGPILLAEVDEHGIEY